MNTSLLHLKRFIVLATLGLFSALFAVGSAPSPLSGVLDRVVAGYQPGSVLVIGELHGTQETPALVHALVERLAGRSNVSLGVEIPRQEQARIDAYLASDGGANARADLLAGAFWQRPAERSDGRRSEAMLGLLESIRRSRADVAIRVIALDDERFFDEGVDRSAELADHIVALRRESGGDAVVVVLGNYHARLITPINARVDGVRPTVPPLPTAARVRDVPLQTVDASACSGGFWSCRSSDEPCGVVKLPAGCDADSAPRLLELDPQGAGYHLRIILPRLTPSPPAR